MPLWAESRIHGDVYVRFGGRLSETYHRKVAWRRQPSLRVLHEIFILDEDLIKFRFSFRIFCIIISLSFLFFRYKFYLCPVK